MSCPVKTKDELLKDMRNFVVGGSTTFKVLNNGDIFIPFGLSKNIKTKQQAVEIGYKKIDKLNDIYKDLVSFLDTTKTDGVIVKIQPSNSFLLKNTLPVESTNLKGLVKELNRYTPDYYNNDYFLMEQEIKQDFDEKDLFRALPLPFINYQFKAVDRILNNKKRVDSLWNQIKEKELFWNKIQQELQIPKEQIELLKQSEGDTIEEKLTSFAANYSYTIEINTAKEDKRQWGDYFGNDYSFDNENFKLNNSTYTVSYDEDTFYGYYKDKLEITEKEFKIAQKQAFEKYKANENTIRPTQYYSNLTVPGGTNYTENEISTPLITPSIKGHAQFATDNGIGWFRSDDKAQDNINAENEIRKQYEESGLNISYEQYKLVKGVERGGIVESSKTRRILELQSDLFQKGRDKEQLISIDFDLQGAGYTFGSRNQYKIIDEYNDEIVFKDTETGDVYKKPKEWLKEQNKKVQVKKSENQFLQLLNKNNNWINFFIKAIVQDSAKKRYEKVLFPSGDTASKIEGHTTLEEFKKQKEDIILRNEKRLNSYSIQPFNNKGFKVFIGTAPQFDVFKTKEEAEQKIKEMSADDIREINQLKQELERVEREGFGALKPIYNFYENTVTNILKKQGFNPVLIADEYGNTWNEVDLNNVNIIESVNSILFALPSIKITSEEDYDIQEKNLTDLSEIIESFNDTVYDKFIRYKNSLTVEQIKKENKFVDLEDFIKLIEDPVQKSLINRAKKVNPNIKIEISEKYEGSVYDKKNNIIYISLKEAYALSKVTNLSFKKQLAFLITHEYTHAGIEKILNLPENLELKKQFKLLHEEFLSNNKNKKFNDKIRKGFLDKENFYQEDLSEFIADLSNPYLREYLNNIGIWEKIKNIFKNLINSLFGTNFKLKDSVLNRMMDLYYSTEIENAFLNFTDKNVEDFNESKVLFRALPENVEEELDDKYKTITGKYKAQILALKKRLTQLKNSRDKKPLNSPEWTYYNNLVIKIANGLNLLNDTNRQEIIYDLGKELLFQSESYILGLEKGTISAKNKDLKYTNEIIKAFYPDLDTGDYTGLESKAMELANRLTPFRKKFIEAYVNEHLNSEDKEKTYEDIEKQKEDIGKFRKLTGALSDLGNYLANTIGSIIKEAQNNITVTNKKAAEKIQIEVDLLRDWSKKNGVQEENMYDVFIQEYKGTLILTKSTLEDGTKNENYYKIINTPELKRFYDFHKKMMEEANNDLPVELGPNFIANIQNSFMDDIQNKGVIKSLKGVAKSAINIINYNQIDLTEPKSENLTSDKINLKYIQKLAPNEKSRDLGNSLLEYIKFTNEYKVMTEILPEVRLLQQEIGSKEYRKQGDPNKVIEGKKSNIYQMVDDYINMQVKGEMKKNESITVYDYDENGNPIKAKNLKIDSIIDFGLKYNSLLRIGLNPINAISNVFIGYLGNLIESVGGRFFSFRELNQASAITIKNFFDEKSDFTKAILELNPLQEFEEYNIYNEIKLNKKTSPEKILEFAYSPQRIGEKYLQGKVMVAVLIHNGFMDFNGKFTPKWFTLNEKEKSQLTDKIQRINQMIHGRYSSRDAATAQQYVLYRLISQFRKWIPSAIESRFGEKVYDKRLGVYIEGRYNTYKKFFRLMSAKLKNDQEMILANEFTELDIYNMKKNAMEIALIAASLLAYGGLKGDDDDKNFRKKPIVKFLLNQLNRISGELLYFYNPEEYATLASKAIPLAKTTNDLIRTIEYLPYAFYDYDGKANYRSGIHKGQNKFYVSLFSTLPLFKPGQDIFDVFNKQPYQEF